MEKVDVNLEEFLRLGFFGPVRASATEEDLRKVLGEPEDISISQKPKILKYGNVQITYCDDSVVLITLQFGQGVLKSNAYFAFTKFPSEDVVDIEMFRTFCLQRAIPIDLDKNLTFADQVVFNLPMSGVTVLFMDRVLDKISKITKM